MSDGLKFALSSFREAVTHDLRPLRQSAGAAMAGVALTAIHTGHPRASGAGWKLLMRLHRAGLGPRLDRRLVRAISCGLAAERKSPGTGLGKLLDVTVAEAEAGFRNRPNPDPSRLIGTRILVVKRWRPEERGVLVVDYEYALPLLFGLFDANSISERYDVVLEPSWAGVCAPELFVYARWPRAVTVQTMEPRDHALLDALGGAFDYVPIAANWWVDPTPLPDEPTRRDLDVAMVASWAGIKRHWRFFRTLAQLKREGHVLRAALVGYPGDMTREDIERQARHFGVLEQLELHERVPASEVQRILRRSKIHVLWSRREASGRAISEALLQGTPVIVREGLTFGHPYPYINDQTGAFVPEHDLGPAMLRMIRDRDRYTPRRWVLEHMTCHTATRILEAHLKSRARRLGEPWTEGLAVKVSALDAQRYVSPDALELFQSDYEFLRRAARQA